MFFMFKSRFVARFLPGAFLALSGAVYSFPDIATYSESGVYSS